MARSEALRWLSLGGVEALLKPVSQVRILPGAPAGGTHCRGHTAGGTTAVGVIIALVVAVWWEPKKAREDRKERSEQADEDRRRYNAQMAALQRAEEDRVAAQARKIVPTIFPADLFGENMWTAKVSNTSNGVVTNLDVSVTAVDADGNEIPDGCRQANNQISIGDAFRRLISEALSGAVTGAIGANPMAGLFGQMGGMGGFRPGGMNADQLRNVIDQRLGPEVSERFREAMLGQLVREWMTTLTPSQFAVMAFQTNDRNARLRVVLEFEDEAGYRWRRPDNAQPIRISETSDELTT
jgi:hypothetical protein